MELTRFGGHLTADAILNGREYRDAYLDWGRRYSAAGYGPGFKRWLANGGHLATPSRGNGSAMRVSPIGLAFETEEQVLRESRRSVVVSRDHPEGIHGARSASSGRGAAQHAPRFVERSHAASDMTSIGPLRRSGRRTASGCGST